MYRFSVKTVFIICMLVGCVYPFPQEGLSSTVPNVTSANSVTAAASNNSTEIPETVTKASKKEEEPLKENKTEASAVTESLSTPTESRPVEKKDGQEKQGENCNYKKETVDMIKCHVTPHDDDVEEVVDVTQRPPTTAATKENATVSMVPTEPTSPLNKTVYNTVPPETDASNNANSTDAPSDEPQFNRTEVIFSSIAPLLVDNIRNIKPESQADVKKPVTEDSKSMPSGVIVLVTAITFALAIVFVYVSMIAWRRYVEYRYGHRELLVNDLEFDTNDLRHFEL